MDLKMFSSRNYEDPQKNYGDCVLITSDKRAVIYDCGSEAHAMRIIDELDRKGISQATVILSHNDSDHFDGIPYLIDRGRVNKLFTILLLKYKNELLDRIDDGRRNRDSLGRAITELYDNIASLSGKVTLCDIYEDYEKLPWFLHVVGPNRDYMLDAAAKGLDNREGDTIDGETITNAASVQVQVELDGKKLLLTGDCSAAAIPDTEDLSVYKYIQLPHHGKYVHAQAIFNRTYPNNNVVFLVSDNTGSTNGGSEELRLKSIGHQVRNTMDGDITLDGGSVDSSYIPRRTLGI